MTGSLTRRLSRIVSTCIRVCSEPVVVARSARCESVVQLVMMTAVGSSETMIASYRLFLRRKVYKGRRIVARYLSNGGTDLSYMDKTSDGFESCRGGLIRITVFGRVS